MLYCFQVANTTLTTKYLLSSGTELMSGIAAVGLNPQALLRLLLFLEACSCYIDFFCSAGCDFNPLSAC